MVSGGHLDFKIERGKLIFLVERISFGLKLLGYRNRSHEVLLLEVETSSTVLFYLIIKSQWTTDGGHGASPVRLGKVVRVLDGKGFLLHHAVVELDVHTFLRRHRAYRQEHCILRVLLDLLVLLL
jgi:hypothetical protein